MIIQIRGTSGSGKSTAMRAVMKGLEPLHPYYMEGRKRPLYYKNIERSIVVLGHYDSPCGGADTIGSAAQVHKEVDALLKIGVETVLVEGLLLSEDTKWTLQMPDVHVFFLTTPLETCLEWIGKRRQQVGNDKPLNPRNTANRVGVIERARLKLIDAGVSCRRCSALQAPRLIQQLLQGV